MDKFKEKLAALGDEVNAAKARRDRAEAEVKKRQDDLIAKNEEITSLKNWIAELEAELANVSKAKLAVEKGETSKTVGK
ncbi:MAG: hypothetical protein J3Q66DRAFT_208380 [Benniella sp.]|nr:MAG: hypothetical protein J3Q66DRAFT_208380 [Benniella sp.]